MLTALFKYLTTQFYDPRFHSNKKKYILQCMLATVVIFVTLLLLNVLTSAVVIASIGSSACVVFALPHKESSRAKYLIGGYIIGIVVGSLCYFLMQLPFIANFHHGAILADEIFGALAIGLTIFGMVVLRAEHPPAAALALGLVLHEWSLMTIAITMIVIIVIAVVRHFLRDHLIDLL